MRKWRKKWRKAGGKLAISEIMFVMAIWQHEESSKAAALKCWRQYGGGENNRWRRYVA
jgi:hypothetical protein